MRALLPLLLIALPLAPAVFLAGSACHPDLAPPDPVTVPLPGGYEVHATANSSNGGCSHQPRATSCLSLTRGNETIAASCLNLP